ncbi:hypothetical protein JXI42_06225 [bacterium]|nr:hypothetical protein [bacterium]
MKYQKILLIVIALCVLFMWGCTNFAEPELEGEGNGGEGKNYFSGKGPPPRNLGYDGDMYMDINNGNLYERREGAWVYIGNIDQNPNLQDNFG